ncbi:replication-relaxation family protein [Dictyobacter formicarum]|uniref:HTH arsR-type domain-containing protein n=1 Tax=Dictyobacter formicarum TaxID=2778368 RepID=A0ABQ3VPH5_9CHLR|nr:replication-relaxation family protein [Dictyobacter formicarum]GHO88152.1 hypothetical protein KSZ_61580 [Dictyobacter formicarum]
MNNGAAGPSVTVAATDIEEQGSFADQVLFWLLKHPYQRASDLAFVFQRDRSTISRHLSSLLALKLIEAVHVACLAPARAELVYHLSAAGVEQVAARAEVKPAALAALWQTDEHALLRLLPRLPAHIPLQDAIYSFVAETPRHLSYRAGERAVVRWHWQHQYRHTVQRGAKRITCHLDGVVVLSRQAHQKGTHDQHEPGRVPSWYCVFWLVDPGLVGDRDLDLIRQRLRALLQWREASERWPVYHAFPPLLILAPTAHQRDLWIRCAQEEAAHLRVAPLCGACAMRLEHVSSWRFAWHGLDGSGPVPLHSLLQAHDVTAIPPGLLAPRMVERLDGAEASAPRGRKSFLVGGFSARAAPGLGDNGSTKQAMTYQFWSLRLCYRHLVVLQQLYASPLLALPELASLLRSEPATIRRYLVDLRLNGLVMVREKRYHLSEEGLRLLAAMLGVSFSHVAQYHDDHWQQRGIEHVWRLRVHAAGVYGFLARLQQQAWARGEELLWWETRRCAHRYRLHGRWHNLMPDALFSYQGQGKAQPPIEAWLEWDRGTMHGPALITKFEAYAHYIRSSQYRQDHQMLPQLLLVVPSTSREHFLAQLVQAVLVPLGLPVWTTTVPLMQAQGPASAIWKRVVAKDQDADSQQPRVSWV